MGRPRKDFDVSAFYDLASTGMNQKEIAEELGLSVPTLEKRIADIQTKQGVLLKYRELQPLQLTELQARILEAITPERIESASLGELVSAFKILKEKELVAEGKPSDIKGLVGYLLHIEKEESKIRNNIIEVAQKQGVDVELAAGVLYEEVGEDSEEDDRLPKL